MGDGSELGVVSTPFGVVGGLLCWENYMPLARAAIYAQHCDIYLAPTWDNSDTWVATLRHIDKYGGQFVIGVAQVLRASGVLDRKKDMINRGGYKVYCAEVESTLLGYPGVVEAAVVAVPCSVLGERVHAFVTVKEQVKQEILQSYCAAHLSDYKVPETFTLR